MNNVAVVAVTTASGMRWISIGRQATSASFLPCAASPIFPKDKRPTMPTMAKKNKLVNGKQ